MSAYVLLSGALHRDPAMRTAKTGKVFVTALVRAESQGDTLWANVVAFDEAAAQGRRGSINSRHAKDKHFREELRTPGKPRRGSVHILALRQPRHERAKAVDTGLSPEPATRELMMYSPNGEAAEDVELTRLALARMREILAADDQSIEAGMSRELQLSAAQSALANARRAKEQLLHTGGLTPLAGLLQEIAAFGTVH